ncbi:cupin domain-containing protein [Neptunomonas sp.]|uniref:cupin domain-containing protein n=1 Tax=Neptunomonas sp. TaxID=1971898 RepID=UPI003565A798
MALCDLRIELLANIFSNIPSELPNEIFEDIIITEKLRVERIVSKGQTSPNAGWYDQGENEWVIVLSGYGVIEYKNGVKVTLRQGDYLHIKAHEKHRVIETSSDEITVWLAIFY